MSVTETVKSTFIKNRDASPIVGTSAAIAGGTVKSAYGQVLTGAASQTGSYYPIAQVPSNARVSSVRLQTAALGTSCTMNIGVYVPTNTNAALLALSSSYTNAAAISATFFGSAIDVSSAVSPAQELAQSGTDTMVKQEQELWQALGLASDPGCNLDIAFTFAAPTVAGGLVGLAVDYVS